VGEWRGVCNNFFCYIEDLEKISKNLANLGEFTT
jgi:hypothetical protein